MHQIQVSTYVRLLCVCACALQEPSSEMYKKALEMCDKVGTLGYQAMTAWCSLRYTQPTALGHCLEALLSVWWHHADLNSRAVRRSEVIPCVRAHLQINNTAQLL